MLVAGVVHDEVDDHAHAALVRGVDELHEVGEVAELGQHGGVVGDVVAAVPQRGLEERRQPEAVDAQPLQIVELGGEALEVADAVAVAVLEGADQDLVEDGAFEPVGVAVLGGGVLERVVDGLIDDHDVGDPPICGEDGRRTAACARARAARLQAHIVVPAPVVGLAGELVAHRHGLVPVEAELRHVQRDRGLLGVVRVEVDDHQNRVRCPSRLRVGDHRVVVGVVEVEVAQLLQGGVPPPDPVERGDQRGDGAALALGRLPVAGPQLVLLRVQVLLAARAHRGVLAQLVAGVDAPGGREGRGEHGAHLEGGAAAVLEVGVQDVGGVHEEVGPHVGGARRPDSSVRYSVSSCLVLRQVK